MLLFSDAVLHGLIVSWCDVSLGQQMTLGTLTLVGQVCARETC